MSNTTDKDRERAREIINTAMTNMGDNAVEKVAEKIAEHREEDTPSAASESTFVTNPEQKEEHEEQPPGSVSQ